MSPFSLAALNPNSDKKTLMYGWTMSWFNFVLNVILKYILFLSVLYMCVCVFHDKEAFIRNFSSPYSFLQRHLVGKEDRKESKEEAKHPDEHQHSPPHLITELTSSSFLSSVMDLQKVLHTMPLICLLLASTPSEFAFLYFSGRDYFNLNCFKNAFCFAKCYY